MTGRTLVIEALSLNYGKAFGFQEFLFNILKYFKQERTLIRAERVLIVCKEVDRHAFERFAPEMEIVAFGVKNTLHRYFILNTLYWRLHLSEEDVILFTNNYSALTKQCKYVTVVHDLLYLRKEYMPQKAFRIQRTLFVPRSVRIADKVIAISNWVKRDIEEQFHVRQKDKVVAIRNFFDFDKFYKGKPTAEIVTLCRHRDYFLVVCSSAVHKNTITILQAYRKYVERGGVKELLVLGGIGNALSEYVNGLDKHIREKIISISGISNADLCVVYQNAAGYISATLFEGLGMPIVEAMYFGIPCIVSDIPVVREVTCEKASYFNPKDVDSLCKLMGHMQSGKDKAMSDMIENMYSAENTVMRYITDVINPLFIDKGNTLETRS